MTHATPSLPLPPRLLMRGGAPVVRWRQAGKFGIGASGARYRMFLSGQTAHLAMVRPGRHLVHERAIGVPISHPDLDRKLTEDAEIREILRLHHAGWGRTLEPQTRLAATLLAAATPFNLPLWLPATAPEISLDHADLRADPPPAPGTFLHAVQEGLATLRDASSWISGHSRPGAHDERMLTRIMGFNEYEAAAFNANPTCLSIIVDEHSKNSIDLIEPPRIVRRSRRDGQRRRAD